VPGFNITDAIEKFSEHLDKYGGHSLAAGFTVKPGELDIFKTKLVEYAQANLTDEQLIQELVVDAVLSTDDLTLSIVEALNRFKPFGFGNRKPVFMLPNVVVVEKKTMGAGGNHMRLTYKGDGIGTAQAIMFDCLEDVEKINSDDVLDLAGSMEINEWNGNTNVQFQVKEWRRAI
jgi:single-stranded-DNA-specific exonuclease